mgnify:CR=1 FL=1
MKSLTYKNSTELVKLQYIQSQIIGAKSGLMYWSQVDTTGYGFFYLTKDSTNQGPNFIKATNGIKSRQSDLAELKRMQTDALLWRKLLGDLEIYIYIKSH